MNLLNDAQSIFSAMTNSQDLVNLLQFPFMQRAVIGAVLMGIMGGLLGSFVTLRQLSFFSHAVGMLR